MASLIFHKLPEHISSSSASASASASSLCLDIVDIIRLTGLLLSVAMAFLRMYVTTRKEREEKGEN